MGCSNSYYACPNGQHITFRTLCKLNAVDLCLVKNLCLFCESSLLLFGLFFVSFHVNMVCAVTNGIERI